jgi:hypothetical protein
MFIHRRKILLAPFLAAASQLAFAQKLKNNLSLVWTGFGLNGSFAQDRFQLTREYIRGKYKKELRDTQAFGFLRQPLKSLIEKNASSVVFKDSVEFGQDLLLGFAHDYEITLGARVEHEGENANTLFVFMSGVALVLSFNQATGWRVISSFPFTLRLERAAKDLKNIKKQTIDIFAEVYQSYGNAFVQVVNKFNGINEKWSSNYFARLTSVKFHAVVKEKLLQYKIQNFLNTEFIGFSASSIICENFNIPLLPYQENDALSKRYAVKFTDDLMAQNAISIPDADLKFEIILRDIDKQLIDNTQKGLTYIRRKLVVQLRVIDEFATTEDKVFFKTFAALEHDDKMPLGSTEDDTPERDILFFERLFSKILSNLLIGIQTKNYSALSQLGIQATSVENQIPRLLELLNKTR